MWKRMRKSNSGFTLIEIVVTLVLVGIMATMGGMFIVQAVKGYLTVQANSRITQQAQMAMNRISREIIEMLRMTANGTATTLSIAHAEGNRTIGLDDGKIKINNVGGALSGGDILIDHVQSFTLTYWSGSPSVSSSTWPLTNDIQLLSAIDIELQLNYPGGGTLSFTSRVAPRNNKNLGGAAPPATPPPSVPPRACVVATAAYGNHHHPHVHILRDFRDRYLLTWQGGRFLTEVYYTWGGQAADWLRIRPDAAAAARIMLLPLTGLAFVVIYAPAGLFFLLVLALILARCLHYMRRGGRGVPRAVNMRGGILLGLIVTMLIISILGAAMTSLFSASLFSHVSDASGRRAYFLAESGFRYAASLYLNAGSDSAKLTALSNMNNLTCNLLNNDGSFHLRVYPYWFTVSSVSGRNLTVQVHGQLDSELALTSGNLWINNTRYPYSSTRGATPGAQSFTFVAASAWPNFTAGTDVFSAASPSAAQTVTRGGNLTLSATGTGAFPLINGNFRLDPAPPGTSRSTVYTYQKRTGNTLMGVDLANTGQTWINLPVLTTTNVILDKYLRLDSTGTFGGYSRQVIYNVPIGWTAGGSAFLKAQYHDQFTTTANWQAPTTGGGTHSIQTIDGSGAAAAALKVDSASSAIGLGRLAMLFFNSANTPTNLPQAWMDGQGFLSYDLQVKVRNDRPYYMAGIGFRARNSADGTDLYTYGISLIKPRQTRVCIGICFPWFAPDDLPRSLIPGYTSDTAAGPLFSNPGLFENLEETTRPLFGTQSRFGLPAIVLWQRTSAGTRWLAYRRLTAADGIVTLSGVNWRMVNWTTLMVRVAEGNRLAFNNGGGESGVGVPIKVGDVIRTLDGTKSARVVMTPILTSGSWAARNAAGTFVLANIKGAFATGDIIYVGSTQLARANGNLDTTKRNYIRVYYTDPTVEGTANAIETDNNRLANPRNSANWPPDDLTDLSAANDFVTLVQWTGYNTGFSAFPSTNMPNAIIMTSDLVTGSWTESSSAADFSGDSIALITLSDSAAFTYYDDFAIQLFMRAGTGFLPPIQQ